MNYSELKKLSHRETRLPSAFWISRFWRGPGTHAPEGPFFPLIQQGQRKRVEHQKNKECNNTKWTERPTRDTRWPFPAHLVLHELPWCCTRRDLWGSWRLGLDKPTSGTLHIWIPRNSELEFKAERFDFPRTNVGWGTKLPVHLFHII